MSGLRRLVEAANAQRSGTYAPTAAGALDLSDGLRQAAYTPTFTKYSGNPIMTLAQLSTLTSMQWPWLVKLSAPGQYGELWRIYYSTDHETTTAAVGLLTAPSRLGPWTDRGLIFRDTTSGNQTETPACVWDPDNNRWNLYYHQTNGVTGAVAGQVTVLATSPNGVDTWTRQGIAVDLPASDGTSGYPAAPAIGYFRPWRVGKKWFAYCLLGSGNYPRFALCHSRDGVSWFIDPRPLGNGAEWGLTSNAINWNSGNVFAWRGRMWWIGLIGDFSSGGGGRSTYYALATLSDDMRNFTGPPRTVFSSLQGWETNPADNRAGGGLVVDSDGTLVLAYSGSTTGFGLALGV